MAFSLNKQEIIGNLGRDGEIKFMSSGDALLTFSVATTNSYKKGDEWINETDWHNVVYFGKNTEGLSPYLKKGKKVYVSGRPKIEKYTNKEGKEVITIKLIADKIIPLEGKEISAEGNTSEAPTHETHKPEEVENVENNDDLPF